MQPLRLHWCPFGRLAQLPSLFEYVLHFRLLFKSLFNLAPEAPKKHYFFSFNVTKYEPTALCISSGRD
jgi:hypothetical protein